MMKKMQGFTKTATQITEMPRNIEMMKAHAHFILAWCDMPESEPARQCAWAKAARAVNILEDLAIDLGEYTI